MMNILVTGGLGFIGSHVCIELLEEGHHVIVVDNLINSNEDVVEKIKQITKNENITFYNFNIGNKTLLKELFQGNKIDCVIHMAGLKAVNESIHFPLKYYKNNISETLNLLEVMQEAKCKKIIFSSSATVYGTQKYPVDENSQTGNGITNPYGKTKYMLEEIFQDVAKSDKEWSIVMLRYFNPVGAHPSGLIGEDPKDIPNNLFPYILKTATKELPKLNIFGKDYDTPDGTCMRDFIHVCDLAKGHICSLKKLEEPGIHIYNLGTGTGISVLEFVNKFIEVTGINLHYEFTNRRDGDLPNVFAIVNKAHDELGWKTEKTLNNICTDGWNFTQKGKML